jgi:hypothetical protein
VFTLTALEHDPSGAGRLAASPASALIRPDRIWRALRDRAAFTIVGDGSTPTSDPAGPAASLASRAPLPQPTSTTVSVAETFNWWMAA